MTFTPPHTPELFAKYESIHSNDAIPLDLKYTSLRQVLEQATDQLLASSANIPIRLVDRLNFLFNKHGGFDRINSIHDVRRTANQFTHGKGVKDERSEAKFLRHWEVVGHFLGYFFDKPQYLLEGPKHHGRVEEPAVPFAVVELVVPSTATEETAFFQGPWRVVVSAVQPDGKAFRGVRVFPDDRVELNLVLDEWQEADQKRSNLQFSRSFAQLQEGMTVNLLRIVQRGDDCLPQHVVIEPDYLVNATTIAQSIYSRGYTDLHTRPVYVRHSLSPIEPNVYFLRGNIVNAIFDANIQRSEVDVRAVLMDSFREAPLDMTVFSNNRQLEERGIFTDIRQNHVKGIEQAIASLQLPSYEALKSRALEAPQVEPTFINPVYGLSGRLDYYKRTLHADGSENVDILELKTSNVRPGTINPENEAQVGIYDLLLRDVSYGEEEQAGPTYKRGRRQILYSKDPEAPLRGFFQKEQASNEVTRISFKATQLYLEARNQIVLHERALLDPAIQPRDLFLAELAAQPEGVNRFDRDRAVGLQLDLGQLDEIEGEYFNAFTRLAAQEKWAAKLGSRDPKRPRSGHARLWLNELADRDFSSEGIEGLAAVGFEVNEQDLVQTIVLKRSEADEYADNLKQGDAVYLREESAQFYMKWQMFPATIVRIEEAEVEVELRHPQLGMNQALESEATTWRLDQQMYESSHQQMVRNLVHFARASAPRRQLLLGRRVPEEFPVVHLSVEGLTPQQQDAVDRVCSSKEYFLIHGGPGSGKTSRVLKSIVARLVEAGESVLLLSNTNKAADKICEAVLSAQAAHPAVQFFRIGRMDAMAPELRPHTLEQLVASDAIASREDVNKLISNTNVVVGTLAGIPPEHILFMAKRFDTVIIDEASQILEPAILGLLSKMGRFILIGDHYQLPAVTQTPTEDRQVPTTSPLRSELGLQNLGDSFFERLYRQCQTKGWHHAIAELSFQGRMHADLQCFPGIVFYGDSLAPIDEKRQHEPLAFPVDASNEFEAFLAAHRLCFLHTKAAASADLKSNEAEAECIADAVAALIQLNGEGYEPSKEIGVITPFRSQRTKIRNRLQARFGPLVHGLRVDTVESFQGDECNTILVSFCANSTFALDQITAFNDDLSIDRKLNVTLTRARNQLILVGDSAVLSTENVFHNLIEHCAATGGFLDLSGNTAWATEFDSTLPEAFRAAHQRLVIDRIKADPRTQWADIILGKDVHFNRMRLIEAGRANFGVAVIDHLGAVWSPEDRVLAYCFYNMRQHFHSSQAVLAELVHRLDPNSPTTFIDIGCGPGTSAAAIAAIRPAELAMNFLLYDIAPAMVQKALEFASALLPGDAVTGITNLSEVPLDALAERQVVLNYSFLFGNINVQTADELLTLALNITRSASRVHVVHQNSIHEHLNRSWAHFKRELIRNGFASLTGAQSASMRYRNHAHLEGSSTQFSYEILSSL